MNLMSASAPRMSQPGDKYVTGDRSVQEPCLLCTLADFQFS